MTLAEMIVVLQAAKAGKSIERRPKHCLDEGAWGWCRCPGWDFVNNDYRVKPEQLEIVIYKQGSTFQAINLSHWNGWAESDKAKWPIVKTIKVDV